MRVPGKVQAPLAHARGWAGPSSRSETLAWGTVALRESRVTGVSASIGICPEVFLPAYEEIINQISFLNAGSLWYRAWGLDLRH